MSITKYIASNAYITYDTKVDTETDIPETYVEKLVAGQVHYEYPMLPGMLYEFASRIDNPVAEKINVPINNHKGSELIYTVDEEDLDLTATVSADRRTLELASDGQTVYTITDKDTVMAWTCILSVLLG